MQVAQTSQIVFRARIMCNGRRTNRISCPLEKLHMGASNVSFDKCKSRTCGYARMVTERGVYCTYPSNSRGRRRTA
jgi:hypothetical protein